MLNVKRIQSVANAFAMTFVKNINDALSLVLVMCEIV